MKKKKKNKNKKRGDYVGAWIEREVEWARHDGLQVVVGPRQRGQDGHWQQGPDPPSPAYILHRELGEYGELEAADGWEYEVWKRARGRRIR
jgi:hypothetical protein